MCVACKPMPTPTPVNAVQAMLCFKFALTLAAVKSCREVQVLLNPLHDPDDKIKPHDRVPFHQAVLAAARKNHVV